MIGMRRSPIALTLALPLAACAGGSDHHAHGPAGIPYLCTNGQPARVYYEGGGWHERGRAKLLYDGGMLEFRAIPPTYGLRYETDDGHADGPILYWSARGEEAWLTELEPGSETEREIAHCTRVREPGTVEAHGPEEPAHH